jgi:hypothetical protein
LTKPSALIVTAGIITLVLSGCPPLPPPPPPPPPPTLVAQVCDANGNLNEVPFLKEPFRAGPPYGEDPQPDPAPINPDVQSDLVTAFNSAPPSFRNQLCKLNRIFISRDGCTGYDPNTCNLTDYQIAHNSWGFREPDGDKYIAISLGLWKPDPEDPCPPPHRVCAPRFQKYHTRLIRALLQRTAEKGTQSPVPAPGDPDPPSVDVSPNISTLSVLATLAHEYGHILWWDTFVQPPGTTVISNTANFCGGNFYPSGSWEAMKVDIPPGRWIDFGDIRLQPSGSDVSQLPELLGSGNYRGAARSLSRIYSSRRWASALAAYSPDEDFVETFELSVLVNANPGLQSSRANIGHGQPGSNILPVNPASPLGKKLQCFGSIPQLRRAR